MHLLVDADHVYTGRCFFSFSDFKKHIYVYAFPAYVAANICLISGDVKDSAGI